MKRNRACGIKGLAAALLALALLAGCAGPAGGAAEVSGFDTAESKSAPAQDGTAFLPLENLVSCDQKFSQTGTEDGAYIRRTLLDWSEVLTFIDYEAKIGVPLCSQANCTHSDDTCTAWLPVGWNTQFVLNDKLYVICSANGDAEELLEMDLNGQNRRQVLQLNSNEIFSAAGVVGNAQYLFFGVQETKPETGWPEYTIRRLDLKTGKLEKIHQRSEGKNNTVTLLGACGDQLVIQYVDALGIVQESNDASDAMMVETYCIDQNGQRIPGDYPAWQNKDTFMNYAGTCLYRTNNAEGTLTIYDFADGSETTVQDDRLRCSTITYMVEALPEGLILSVESEDPKAYPNWYLYRDGELTPSQYAVLGELDTRTKNRVVQDAGAYYLVQRDYSYQYPQYALVAKEDFWADANTDKDISIWMDPLW